MSKNIYYDILDSIHSGKKACMVSNLIGKEGIIGTELEKKIVLDSTSDLLIKKSFEEVVTQFGNHGEELIICEPFFPEERLIILGGGHIALPLVDFAAKTGFQVTVVDDRLSFANSHRFPLAKSVICDNFEPAIQSLNIKENDYVVIITRGHRYDSTCLESICKGEEPSYVGMIGSRRRTAIVKETLAKEGCNIDRLNRVRTPIGLDIGSITPEEIAISILAELISYKRIGAKASIKRNCSDIDYDVLKVLAEEPDISKAIITVVQTKGSVPRGAGAKMIVYKDGMILGSIGGGCSEAAVIGQAREMIGTKTFKVVEIDLTGEAAEEEGMVCGGIMTVLLEDYIV